MAPKRTNRPCSIDGCGRRHAAHGLCLMHYKRQMRHGSPEYRWAGRVVGRSCKHCDRPVTAREMCVRHYQMWHRHGDALYADKQKKHGLPSGTHERHGYLMVCPVVDAITKAAPVTNPAIEKGDRPHAAMIKNHGLRDGSQRYRREWEHRKIAKARKGEIVHHIDLDAANNDPSNLHVFPSPAAHSTAHRSLERAACALLRAGLLFFDRAAGVYRPTQSVDRSTS